MKKVAKRILIGVSAATVICATYTGIYFGVYGKFFSSEVKNVILSSLSFAHGRAQFNLIFIEKNDEEDKQISTNICNKVSYVNVEGKDAEHSVIAYNKNGKTERHYLDEKFFVDEDNVVFPNSMIRFNFDIDVSDIRIKTKNVWLNKSKNEIEGFFKFESDKNEFYFPVFNERLSLKDCYCNFYISTKMDFDNEYIIEYYFRNEKDGSSLWVYWFTYVTL